MLKSTEKEYTWDSSMVCATTTGLGMNIALPDVCNTPVGPSLVPIPYPNFHSVASSIPSQFFAFTSCAPMATMTALGLVSLGDNVGVGFGVMSGIVASTTRYLLGTFRTLVNGSPVVRMGHSTIQNSTNAFGANTIPSQFRLFNLRG